MAFVQFNVAKLEVYSQLQSTVPKAAFILILRRQNQRFEPPIQNADPKRR